MHQALVLLLLFFSLARGSPLEHVVAGVRDSDFFRRAPEVRGVLPRKHLVRMRDGVLLDTLVWDAHLLPSSKAPCVLVRSPYSSLGTQNLAELFLPFGFVSVMQNQRGTGGSGGNWSYWSSAARDAQDTLAWIAAQPWSDGRVFEAGASADGILTTEAMMLPQPTMRGQWLLVTTSVPYRTMFQNSQASREALTKNWLDAMQLWRPELPPHTYYDFVLHMEGKRAQYGGLTWDQITLSNLSTVDFAGVHWAGWYDIFLQPQLLTWRHYATTGKRQQLIVGPLGHCQFEHKEYFPGAHHAYTWAFEDAVKSFRAEPPSSGRKLITLYVMGPSGPLLGSSVTGNYFSTMDEFPAFSAHVLHFANDGSLKDTPQALAPMSFIYDPSSPLSTHGGNNLFLQCGPQNQLALEQLPGQLLFSTAPFVNDTAVCGRVNVTLSVSSSAVDTDFVVRMSDVYPDGKNSILIGDNVVRMRWRDGPEANAPPMKPGATYTIVVRMWTTCYVFNAGHRLRVAVTSSNAPRYSANPNNGLPLVRSGPLVVANNTVHSGSVALPVVGLWQLPPFTQK